MITIHNTLFCNDTITSRIGPVWTISRDFDLQYFIVRFYHDYYRRDLLIVPTDTPSVYFLIFT